jgi:NAD-dependent SIR2 family protein deacetylase
MQEEMDKNPILYGCNNCKQEGWIFLDNPKSTVLVICSHCRNEIAYAYCPECDLFTNFLAHSDERRPTSWKCLECKNEYKLNPDFYENPVRLYFEEDIPDEIKSRYIKQTNRQLFFILIALILVIALIARELLF